MIVKTTYGIGSRVFWITDDSGTYSKWVLKHQGRISEPVPDHVPGRCFGNLVWVRDFNCFPYLVHECVHAVDNWMEDIGISNDTEVRAYVLQGLLEKILKVLAKSEKEK